MRFHSPGADDASKDPLLKSEEGFGSGGEQWEDVEDDDEEDGDGDSLESGEGGGRRGRVEMRPSHRRLW